MTQQTEAQRLRASLTIIAGTDPRESGAAYAMRTQAIAALATQQAQEPAQAAGEREPLTTEQMAVLRFLWGVGPLRGVHFGEKPEGVRGNYWWRDEMLDAFPQLTVAGITPGEGS